jgi:hypothetical protein
MWNISSILLPWYKIMQIYIYEIKSWIARGKSNIEEDSLH